MNTLSKLAIVLVLAGGGVVPAVPAMAGPLPAAGVQAATEEPQITKVGEEVPAASSTALTGSDRTVVRHPGATYVKVHFSTMSLAKGDYVTVANRGRTEIHTYRGNPTEGAASRGDSSYTVHGATGFAAMSIDGDTAVVTLHRSAATTASMVSVDRYWRGYTESEVREHNPGLFSVCGTDARRDVECYRSSNPTAFAKSGAVARLLIGGGGACTTWRVGNTNRMLTNKHCMSTQSTVAASEAQFGYQCATCGGNNPGTGVKVSGDQLFRVSAGGSSQLDYALFSVRDFARIEQFGTLYLATRAARTGETMYIAGHGDARPKRMSFYEEQQGGARCTVRNANANQYNINYSCDTSGGNSGSPVLSADHEVIALHHLGGCPGNQGARADLIYREINGLISNTRR